MNAFWFDGDFYLVPQDYPDAAAYLAAPVFDRSVELRKLKAECAFPPFFAADAVVLETVTVAPANAFPTDVVLLTKSALDARVAAAEQKCAGCRWNGGAEAEARVRCPALTLYDSCPLRDPGFDPGFLFYAAAFWRRVEAALPALARLVARQAYVRAAKLVDKLRYGIPDVFIAFADDEGKPTLMLSGAGNDFLHLVAQYLAYTAPASVTARFTVLSSFPKGIYRRLNPGRRDRHDRRPPQVVFTPVRTDRPRFDLSVLVFDAAKDTAPDDAFLFLCEKLGEHKLMGAMNSIRFVDDSGFDLDYHEKALDLADPKVTIVTAETYEMIVDRAYEQEKDASGLSAPFCFYEYYNIEEEEPVGALADVKVIHTCFMELDEDLLYGEDAVLSSVFDAGVGVGRIALELAMDGAGSRERVRWFDELLNQRLHFAGGSVPYGLHLAERRTIFNFLILDKRIVRNAVRALTPVLQAFRGTYAEVWAGGTSTVPASFDFVIPEPRD